jgi:hypothetical protein
LALILKEYNLSGNDMNTFQSILLLIMIVYAKAINIGESTLHLYHAKKNIIQSEIKLTDSTKKITVDDFPVTNAMFGIDTNNNARQIKSGPVYSSDKIWFTNDILKQTLVFELYTDNYRSEIYEFLNNDIPGDLIKTMELYTNDGEIAGNSLKRKYFKSFIKHAQKIDRHYFTTNKGFKAGDDDGKALHEYGKPDKISFDNTIQKYEWHFPGDALHKSKLKGKSLAKDSYGYNVTIYFRNKKLIALIFSNDIP